ncbi:unnamed protein product [Pelagomonas calceolata]|uniref:Phytanoyl-CoA dioxygenase n=1 Tax=Pelagomonas calceolata TaxID=35677 RepID=A0A8J2X206_9STRA|nr:unnamed protein product [Pelagomonas calceolata]
MAATTAAADAAAARTAALQKLQARSAKRKEDQEALRKKLMLKLYLEGLKTKLKAKGRESTKTEAPATTPQQSQHSQEELTIRGDGTRESARACADVLRRHGCACLQTSLDSAKIERCRVLCEEALETTLKDADERGLDRTGLKTKEIVSRQALRFDLVRGIADTEPFSALAKGGPWCSTVRQALGVDMKLIKSGCVVAMPGCPRQPVHPDGKHLFDEGDHLPPHCITVFVPLVDMSGDLGPTEFYPGTHRRDCPPQEYRACETGDCEGVAFTSAKAGDAVMFDYRVLHRGGANSSTRQRPLLYFTYARSWFTDATNYSAVSLDD